MYEWEMIKVISYPIFSSFINELLVSWDAQATASMLEDPFFKKELEKDKTYREKYGIKDDYMKRSLQVMAINSVFQQLHYFHQN